ncbi:toprim domain-containing protein [Acidisoma cellulosilytica]|uniref:Toprim domain-containing protein n=1 Tax=Acidisoma cellulosilyticum TaxID=2802395 RepID=A0A964E6Z7_9PROT|nr:toprim domain-containing protein [Acidisoma cellulosilyticum]MCB8883982.1 toprim domain-containing protein [Acidisoma cellulosilyticum]
MPVGGTVAERYLIETRGIPAPGEGWPEAVRYHEPSRSLLLVATAAGGEVQAVQRVYLDAKARKIGEAELLARKLPAVKQTNGVSDGAMVRLPGDTKGPVLAAEGPETGLSVWAATGHETWVALGSFRKLDPPIGRPFVICRDDDRRHAPADTALKRAVADWTRGGRAVLIATPWENRRFDKSDFNDAIQEAGAAAVQDRIERTINPGRVLNRRQPIAAVRQALDVAVSDFFDAAETWEADHEESKDQPPPVHAIRVDVGAGKTRAAYRYAARRLEAMRMVGDTRVIVVAVPTHKLADEQAQLFNTIAAERGSRLTAQVWRGMSAPDPDHEDARDPTIADKLKTKMCRNLEAVAAAREAGVDVQQAACRKKEKGQDPICCPFYTECGYQRQRRAKADLWIVPHDLLFLSKPRALGDVALLVVDESCWADGLEGANGRPTGITIDDLRQPDRILTAEGATLQIDTDRLHYLRARLLDCLQGQEDGPLQREAMHGDLNHDNATEAHRLEWRRLIDPDLHPGLSNQERKERARSARGNAQTMRVARMWSAVVALLRDGGPQVSGWLSLASEPDEEARLVRVLHIKGRRDVRKGWQVPTLLLDATMDVQLVRPYWPQVELTAELLAEAPHQHVRQIVDRALSKSMIEPLDEAEAEARPDIAKRRCKNLRTVHAILCREARSYAPGRVLIVAQKRVKEAFPSFGPLPANVEVAHHNAVSGRDEWGPQPDRDGIRALIVVGRTAPSPGAVHRLAEALMGSAVEKLAGGWYERGDAVRERLAGHADAIEAERHPDTIAEAIRWQICEGELLQIIGRGRGVNRTVENPLDVLVMTDVPVPTPVAETIAFADLDPTPDDQMMAAAGIILRNARHAASAFPDFWPSHNAADLALRRSRVRQTCKDNTLLYSDDGPWKRATYQLAGARAQPSTAIFDPSTCADPESWLTAKLGPLARFEVEPLQPDLPSPPSPEPTMKPEMLPAGRVERVPPGWMLPRVTDEATATMPILGLWHVHRAGMTIKRVEEAPEGWKGVQTHQEPFFPTPMETILRLARLEPVQEHRL